MSTAEATIPGEFQFIEREMFIPPQSSEDIRLPRYLFTAANMITASFARDRPHMKSGGLNVYNPCLVQSMDFIRRGRLTPLLIGQHTPVPAEEAPDNDTTYYNVEPEGESKRGLAGPLESVGMKSRLAYPGQQIQHIMEGSPNIDLASGRRIGIVEISTLKGHEYRLVDFGDFRADKELWGIQKAIFPNYPKLPVLISEFTDLIKRAIDNNTGDLRRIAEEELPSCYEWEGWMLRAIEKTHQDMAQAAVKGYAAPYEELDLVILEQLGMRREDEHFKRSAQQAAQQQPQQAPMSHADYLKMKEEIMADFRAEQAANQQFSYVPDVFVPNGNNPAFCAVCGFAKTNLSAHPEAIQASESTMKEKPKGK